MSEPYRDGTLKGGAWIKSRPSCYTPSQILQYLAFIKVHLDLTEDQIRSGRNATSLQQLTLVVQQSLLALSWENTSMH